MSNGRQKPRGPVCGINSRHEGEDPARGSTPAREQVPQVSIELFTRSRDKYEGVVRFVRERAAHHVVGQKVLLIVGCNGLQVQEFGSVLQGPIFDRRGRQRAIGTPLWDRV
jgi:hypothetical protein